MLMSVRGAIAATLLAGSAFVAMPAFADEAAAPSEITVTGNVALTSDYRFRGISQTIGKPAIQGGMTVGHSSGLYATVWSSSVEFDGTSQEVDLSAGWSGEIASGLTFDGGLLYYAYPGANYDSDFFEPYASISGSVGPAKVKVGAAYAWDQKALADEDNLYVFSNVDVAIPSTPLTVSAHVGYTDGFMTLDGDAFDYSIGASATVLGPVSLGVSYVGMDGPSVKDFTDDAVVATLTATF